MLSVVRRTPPTTATIARFVPQTPRLPVSCNRDTPASAWMQSSPLRRYARPQGRMSRVSAAPRPAGHFARTAFLTAAASVVVEGLVRESHAGRPPRKLHERLSESGGHAAIGRERAHGLRSECTVEPLDLAKRLSGWEARRLVLEGRPSMHSREGLGSLSERLIRLEQGGLRSSGISRLRALFSYRP